MGLTQKLGTIPLAIQTDSSNNVGIGGTPSGSFKLEVTGASKLSGFLGVNGSPATSFPFEAYINSSTAYSSTSRGNVMRVYNSNTGANVFAGIELGGAGTANDGLAGINAVVTGSGSAALTFYTRDGGTFAERFRVAASGNVAIGTSSPLYKTHIVNSGANAFIGISNQGAGNGDRQLIMGFGGNGSETFATIKGTRYNVADDVNIAILGGNVGIATTSPAALLTLKGRGGADIIFQMNDESNIRRCFYIPNQYYGYMWAVGVVSNGGKAFSFGNENGSEVGTIVINSSSVAYNTTSDYRLKEDLKDFDGLSILSKVKFYDFKWKSEDTRTTGVIAHELQEVVPYAVNGEKDAIGKDENPAYQGVDYSKLISIMGKAIQQLEARLAALENKS